MWMKPSLASFALTLLSFASLGTPAQPQSAGFKRALDQAERALKAEDMPRAWESLQRALERDPKSIAAWGLRARWAEANEDRDELVYSLYRQVQLSRAQGASDEELEALRAQLEAVDPQVAKLTDLLARAGFDHDPVEFRRYGSARKLYNFDIDHMDAY